MVLGNEDEDRIFGGFGEDRLWGDDGYDEVLGDAGRDRIGGAQVHVCPDFRSGVLFQVRYEP
ncbi:MAG: hypothetical protein Kilf2KO_25940 [Rhodospirillales bacterium]